MTTRRQPLPFQHDLFTGLPPSPVEIEDEARAKRVREELARRATAPKCPGRSGSAALARHIRGDRS